MPPVHAIRRVVTLASRADGDKPHLVAAVPVVIIGGGPVGLAAALELARYGVRSLLVERHESTTWHPKARNLNTRTMEIARGWGAAVHDALVDINLPRAWTSQIIYTRTLAGE